MVTLRSAKGLTRYEHREASRRSAWPTLAHRSDMVCARHSISYPWSQAGSGSVWGEPPWRQG